MIQNSLLVHTASTTMLSPTCTTKVVSNITVKTLNGKLLTFAYFNDAVQSFLA